MEAQNGEKEEYINYQTNKQREKDTRNREDGQKTQRRGE